MENFDMPILSGNTPPATDPLLRQRIEYWYEKLAFPKSFDADFRKALDEIPISDGVSIDTYDLKAEDGKRNLLSFLAMCDDLAAIYAEKGLPEAVLLDSLSDIPRWTKVWSEVEGTLCLRELGWLRMTLGGKLFKLGRLQFALGSAPKDAPELGVKKGDPVIEIHIPRDGPLDPAACDASFAMAETFFATYFPEFNYRYYTCHSWLLDETIDDLLGEGSNITAFRKRFQMLAQIPADDIFRYCMDWTMTREKVAAFVCRNNFGRRVQAETVKGRRFYVGYGIIPR